MSAKGKYENNCAKDEVGFRHFKPEICNFPERQKRRLAAAFST